MSEGLNLHISKSDVLSDDEENIGTVIGQSYTVTAVSNGIALHTFAMFGDDEHIKETVNKIKSGFKTADVSIVKSKEHVRKRIHTPRK